MASGTKNVNKNSKIGYLNLFIPNITAFVAAFCIMVVELIASRIIARHLGASLYTWTSVIGVVLAGISLGNYIGGYLADRFPSIKTLSVLFILASISCAIIPLLNNLTGQWVFLWYLSWPLRITLHVTLIFLLPSTILGMIGPVVAKFALDQGFKTGRTIGDIYAWGVIGSIVGTFLTGYFLIAKMGSMAVIWSVAGILAFVGVCYGRKYRLSRVWIVILIVLMPISLSNQSWAKITGEVLGLREKVEPNVVYRKDSPYFHIKVEELQGVSESIRSLVLDRLSHSKVYMSDPADIQGRYQYNYVKMFGALTEHFAKKKKEFNALCIGGGGYVFPQYLEKNWPKSSIEVIEIDPEVTQAAYKFLGLSEDTSLKIHHLDARNYIEDLILRKARGESVAAYDFVYSDVANDLSAPFQLTTYEFNEKLVKLFKPDGIYIFNLIDSFYSGKFLGAVLNTLEKSFPNLYVFSAGRLRLNKGEWNTFVIVASLTDLDFNGFSTPGFISSKLEPSRIKLFKERSKGIILTDDYAPVENLLKPVARRSGALLACGRLLEKGNLMLSQKKYKQAINFYKKALKINPDYAEGYSNIGAALARQDKLDEAVLEYTKALEINPDFAEANYSMGNILLLQGKVKQAESYFKKVLEVDPKYAEVYFSLGNIFLEQKNFDKAIEHYAKAIRIESGFAQAYNNLGRALLGQGRIEGAIECYRQALKIKPDFEAAKHNLERAIAGKQTTGLKDVFK
ncbi:MAG: fused MFS/spermidine synthase [Candidatus Omnitrophica bacterium]|nr:fused MFS/spermidine synthase [Candidatus Omnitrophota bacterium]